VRPYAMWNDVDKAIPFNDGCINGGFFGNASGMAPVHGRLFQTQYNVDACSLGVAREGGGRTEALSLLAIALLSWFARRAHRRRAT